MTPKEFTDEDVERFYQYFLPDAELILENEIMTKAEIEQLLVALKKDLVTCDEDEIDSESLFGRT